MASDYKAQLDRIDWELLEGLQRNARESFAELGRRTKLTAPAVAQRVRRLEDIGVIRGYRASVDRARLGLGIAVFIRIQSSTPNYSKLEKLVAEAPEILECHHVTGSEAFIVKAAVSSVAHLEELIARLSAFGQTATSLVLSSMLTEKAVDGRTKRKEAAK
jgi:Lrp/AsnC family transcriptional regulator, leucine-responsive regulatory protein